MLSDCSTWPATTPGGHSTLMVCSTRVMVTLLLFEHSSCQRPFAKLHTVKLRKGLITALLCTMWPTWVMQGHRQQLSHLRGRSITMATFPCSTAVSTLQQVCYLETWRSVRFMENPLRDSQHWRKQQDESSSARKIWCPNLSVTWTHAARLPRPGVMEMKWLYNINGDLKLVFSLVSAGAGFDILGQLVEHNPGLIIN